MDPIVGNSANINQHHSGVAKERAAKANSHSSEPIASVSRNSILDLSSLASEAINAGDEIREDVIARAEKLLSDPNWLNDSNLDSLSDRILSVEGI
jgi:hypothetical protein